MRLPFTDREEAGRDLADYLMPLELERPLILGVPRGGVLVAARVAATMGGDLDVVVVRKVGAPNNPELGLGAVGATGEPALDTSLIASIGVPDDFLAREIERERAEARRRIASYRGDAPEPD